MEFLNAISPLLTFISIFIGIYVYWRQMNAQLFIEYAKRYEEIMGSYPDGARGFRLHSDGEPLPESSELTTAVLRYLNLCSEEFYLWQRWYLSGDIWRIWENEMRRTLASPLYRREWQKVKDEFASYPEFAEYVSKSQSKRSA
jgi:hypothetical protein